ncbi:MAG: flagellar hook-basal body protein [Candidatus Electryonea clarkiae]|nr:flagellar hook-basal body protein [Candidatus Electryonea clarkiae]MDP8289217.1 flagellar hook-basal body protein [Candidatus Electryonea clarkiae]
MIKGIYHSAAGMVPRFMRLAAISNNMANANTTAFKSDKVYFTAVLNNQLVQQGALGDPARSIDEEMTYKFDLRQGSVEQTQQPAHFALQGDGYFVVEDEASGKQYFSRNGNFHLNEERYLVTYLGLNVLSEGGSPIRVDGDEFVVSENGQIVVDGRETDRFKIVDFEDKSGISKYGDSMFIPDPDNIEVDVEDVKILQGHLETSNINVVEEMVDMITLNRNYESSQRALIAQDSTLKKAVQEIGRY